MFDGLDLRTVSDKTGVNLFFFLYLPRSTTNVKPEEVNLFLAFQGRRVSLDFSFLHTPPPRHTRLAWPAEEDFDIRPRNVGRKTCDAEHPCPVAISGGSGVSGFEPLETTVAICTMFKNEAPYLEEWLQYHRALGVSKVGSPRLWELHLHVPVIRNKLF